MATKHLHLDEETSWGASEQIAPRSDLTKEMKVREVEKH